MDPRAPYLLQEIFNGNKKMWKRFIIMFLCIWASEVLKICENLCTKCLWNGNQMKIKMNIKNKKIIFLDKGIPSTPQR